MSGYLDGYAAGRKSVLVGLDNLRAEQKKAVEEKADKVKDADQTGLSQDQVEGYFRGFVDGGNHTNTINAKADKEFDIRPGQPIGQLGRVLLNRMSRIERHLGLEAGALKTVDGKGTCAVCGRPMDGHGLWNRNHSAIDEKSGLPPLPKKTTSRWPPPKYEDQDAPPKDVQLGIEYNEMNRESYTVRRAEVEAKRRAEEASGITDMCVVCGHRPGKVETPR